METRNKKLIEITLKIHGLLASISHYFGLWKTSGDIEYWWNLIETPLTETYQSNGYIHYIIKLPFRFIFKVEEWGYMEMILKICRDRTDLKRS